MLLLLAYLERQLEKIFRDISVKGRFIIMLILVPLLLGTLLIEFHVHGSLLQEERQLLHGRQLRASAFNVLLIDLLVNYNF